MPAASLKLTMHYYLDGYNCLFGVQGMHDNLHIQRTKFIKRLRDCVRMLNLSVTIVFDSRIQDESTRGHLAPLEYIYTNQYETADQCLIALVERSSCPQKLTVVTSDNHLASCVRAHGGHTIQVHPFVNWLTQRCAKVHKKSQSLSPINYQKKAPSVTVQPVAPNTTLPPPAEDLCLLFEERYRAICAEEEVIKPAEKPVEKAPTRPLIRGRKKLSNRSILQDEEPSLPPASLPSMESETARWQRLFERNSTKTSHDP